MAISPFVQRVGPNTDWYFGVDEADIPSGATGITFKVGDILWLTEAAAGEAPAAQCVTAGDPGTWKKFADLEA